MKSEVEFDVGVVLAVSRSATHTFNKTNKPLNLNLTACLSGMVRQAGGKVC